MKNNWVKVVALSLVVGMFGFNTPTIAHAEEPTEAATVNEAAQTEQTTDVATLDEATKAEDEATKEDATQEATKEEGSLEAIPFSKESRENACIVTYQSGYGRWTTSNGRYRFLFDDGSYAANDIYEIDGVYYGFNAYGYMVTGWYTLYYTDGTYDYFYFSSTGSMYKGWLKQGSKYFFLDYNYGYMYCDCWGTIDGYEYGFDSNGYMLTGWNTTGGEWYYFNASGRLVYNRWIGNYYVDSEGKMVKNSWINGYYVGSDGRYRPAQWVQTNGKWWYRHQDGSYTRNNFEYIDGHWYYFNGNGYMVKGWKKVGSKWYYFNNKGYMLKNQWFGDYYFESSGAMATNKWIGNYYVGADGRWVH